MIGSVSNLAATAFPRRLAELNNNMPTAADLQSALGTGSVERTRATPVIEAPTLRPAVQGTSFGDVLSQAVNGVNAKMQTAEVEKAKVLGGETNNLHQAMLSIQEASVAFSLMTEVRNKLVESYQEIMRMQV